jgi:hypothetical protein
MNTRKVALLLGTVLSTGMLMAQAPEATQAPAANAPQAAQTQPDRPHRAMNPDKQAKHLGKKLGLNQDQVAQIKPILADRQQQIAAVRGDTSLNPQDKHAKMKAIQQDSKTKIEAVLNDTQKQQFEQMLAERRAHHTKGQAQSGQ